MTREERELALYCLKQSSDYHSEVCEECINYPNCDHTIQDDVTETIIKALEQEPSSSEKPNKSEIPTGWIPISERLPEEGQRILISQTTEYGHRIEIDHYDRRGFLMGVVDAWMPLPEPYKAESEGE